ncbi:MAG: hypothetical protein LBE25_06250 [Arthrobacter sp.]|nr:hypothetical protein [Arthrobacter sp.]
MVGSPSETLELVVGNVGCSFVADGGGATITLPATDANLGFDRDNAGQAIIPTEPMNVWVVLSGPQTALLGGPLIRRGAVGNEGETARVRVWLWRSDYLSGRPSPEARVCVSGK